MTPHPKPNAAGGRQRWERDGAASAAPPGKPLSRNARPTAVEMNDADSPTFDYPLLRTGRAPKSLGCLEKG